jgi:predicted RNase H-like nuclease
MVVLFNLNKILRYKAKPNRDNAFRVKEFERYNNYLKALNKASPALKIEKKFLNNDLKKLRLSELKSYEDTIDAVFCAYIAYYYWANPQNCSVLGNMKAGYIMTPVFESMRGTQKALTAK